MSASIDPQKYFFAGGTLSPDAPSYVRRSADDDLLNYLLAGEYCSVLTARRMGKSSLMYQTIKGLPTHRIKSVVVDLQDVGTVVDEEIWYKTVITKIQRSLGFTMNLNNWWKSNRNVSNSQKFIDFFEQVLLKTRKQIIIFIDEIDTTLALDFKDNFFISIRAMFNIRAKNPAFNRLSFVLLGSIAPTDLIQDRTRTPFNIGRTISLLPFNRTEALSLEKGLERVHPGYGHKILDRIFFWTNGHPYLTQKLCQLVVELQIKEYSDEYLDNLVKKHFLLEEVGDEYHFQFMREYIESNPAKKSLLKVYKTVLKGKKVVENKNNSEQFQLRISGLVMIQNHSLVVSNKIYRDIFNDAWVRKNTETDKWLVIGYAFGSLAALILIALVLILVIDSRYLNNLPEESSKCFNNETFPAEERLGCLANLFDPETLIITADYSYLGRDLFFSRSNWAKQKVIFEIVNPSVGDLEVVIQGLYINLADVDSSGQTNKLLVKMRDALQNANLEGTNLCKEIDFWITAREEVKAGNYEKALHNYDEAIRKNKKNPATLFERARIYAYLGENENALKDYEEVIAISPKDTELIAPSISDVTTTITGTPTLTPTFVTTTPLVGILQTPVPVITLENSITPTPSGNSQPGETRSSTTYPFDDTPVQSKFISLLDRITAVKRDIVHDMGLNDFLKSTNPINYPNLSDWGIFPPTVSPIPTFTLPVGVFVTNTPFIIITSVVAPPIPVTFKATINQPSFCHNGPSENYLGAIPIAADTEVDLLGMTNDSGDWFMIRGIGIDICWIKADALEVSSSTQLQEILKLTTVFTTENSVCRVQPIVGDIQTTIPKNWRVVVYGISDQDANWVLVNPHDSTKQCWVSKSSLEGFAYENLPIEAVVVATKTTQVANIIPTSTQKSGGGGNPPATPVPDASSTNPANATSGNTVIPPTAVQSTDHPVPTNTSKPVPSNTPVPLPTNTPVPPPTNTPVPPPTATLCWPPGHCK